MTFRHYLKQAIKTALQDQGNGTDNGELDLFEKLCSSGVATNWKRITPRRFLESLLWCVGAVQKDYQVHSDYFSCQKVLFRKCDPWKIARNKKAIFPEWKKSKLYLKEGMVKSVLYAANEIVVE